MDSFKHVKNSIQSKIDNINSSAGIYIPQWAKYKDLLIVFKKLVLPELFGPVSILNKLCPYSISIS